MQRKRNTLIETTDKEAKKLIAVAMDKEPELTRFGIGIWERRKTFLSGGIAAVTAKIVEGRTELLGAAEEVAAAADWIKLKPRTKRLNVHHSSYGYKHAVESWFSQRGEPVSVANGSFIAAAIGLGVPYAIRNNSPNVEFGFSKRPLNWCPF